MHVSQDERYTLVSSSSIPLRVSKAPIDLTLSTLDSSCSKARTEPLFHRGFALLPFWNTSCIQHTRKAPNQHETQYKRLPA